MQKREEEDILSIKNNNHVDNSSSLSAQHDHHYDFDDPSGDGIRSDLRTINEYSTYATNNFPDNKVYGGNGDSIFNPFSIACLKPLFMPRSSSSESASSSSTSNSAMAGINHQQQQSPQRGDSSSPSEGILSVDDKTMQADYFTSSMLTSDTISLSATPSGSGVITPTEVDLEITPTPINPGHNNQTIPEEFQNEDTRKEQEELEDPRSVDELLAKELNKLSFQERETIYEEIHGIDVRNTTEESPELLSKSFQQLDFELQKLRPECAAWDRCQRLFGNTTYLNSEETRIMFLRCELFDWKKAAIRMCDYAESVLESFGDFALQRRPYLTDLNDLELRVLEAGGYQLLPGRDRAGRRILANLAFDFPKEFGFVSRIRVGLYLILAILDDVETQRKGVVALSWWHNISVDDFIIRKKVHAKVKCVPMRVGAFHCCIPSENKSARNGKKSKETDEGLSAGMAQIVKAMFVVSVGSELRPHLRFHTGEINVRV